MNATKQQAADALAQAVREMTDVWTGSLDYGKYYMATVEALKAYERAKAEAKPVAADWMRAAAKEMHDTWWNVEKGAATIAKHCPHAPAQAVSAGWIEKAKKVIVGFVAQFERPQTSPKIETLIREANHFLYEEHAPAQDSRDSARLHWLHEGGSKDPEGFEWGIFRVKWDENGRPVQVWQTLSDFSDLDAEMARERAAMVAKKTNLP